MSSEMQQAWEQWHNDVSLSLIPMPNISFERAWAIQQEIIDKLTEELIRKDKLINSCISTISKYNEIKT